MDIAKVPLTGRKSKDLAERLLERVQRREIARDGRLPSERALCEMFGVSRTVVREALNSLQMSGIVERRVGDGTYLAEGVEPTKLHLAPLIRRLEASVSVVEAIEAREALDLAVIGLAVENAKPRDLSRMDELVRRLRNAVDARDYPRHLELTLDLHLAIARASGNSVLEQVVEYLIDLIRPNLWVIERNYTPDVAERSFAVHKAMVDGIRAGDRSAALEAVREHYHDYPSLHQ